MARKKKMILATAGVVVLCVAGFAGVHYANQYAAVAQNSPQESNTPMQAYQENDLSAFVALLPNMEPFELEQYLQLAADQKRADFVAALLDSMPESWDASSMMEQAVRSGARHLVAEFLEYMDEGTRWECLSLSVALGYPDLVELFYETLPDANIRELAALAYGQGDTATLTVLLKGLGNTEMEHFAQLTYNDDNIAVFSRLVLPEALAEEYAMRAAADGKTVFINHLNTLHGKESK